MSRDYKRSGKSRSGGGLSGATGVILGLAVGLGIAVAVYIHDRKPEEQTGKPKPARSTPRETAPEEVAEDPGRKFDFYEMLPKFEVVVPDKEKAEASDARPAIEKPGAYVLQVGSYRRFEDADRVRAQLALQGIESKIQRISIDNDTWHRVRIGPIADLAELNRTRDILRQAQIEALVIRVGE